MATESTVALLEFCLLSSADRTPQAWADLMHTRESERALLATFRDYRARGILTTDSPKTAELTATGQQRLDAARMIVARR